jgi:hypothetical protein
MTNASIPQLEPHPLAAIFPPMEGEDFIKLKVDMKNNGQREPTVLFEGKILDGRNRYRACIDLGLEPTTKQYTGSDPHGFVISMNLHRRHLTPEKKREIIAELLKTNPQASDRAIAAQAKVSPTTVGTVRATVQAGQSLAREGQDGKKRKAPQGKREMSNGRRVRQVKAFNKTWDDFADWQQRSFVKTNKLRLVELIDELESEGDALAEEPQEAA